MNSVTSRLMHVAVMVDIFQNDNIALVIVKGLLMKTVNLIGKNCETAGTAAR